MRYAPGNFRVMEKKFKRDLSALDGIFELISEFIITNQIDEEIGFPINLAVEELFTNMVKYNPDNANDILMSLEKDENKLIVTLTDFDAEAFDVTQAKEVDTNQALADRRIGGLGIHLTRKMVDDIKYEYVNRQSKITLIKYLEKQHVRRDHQ
jgi:anti-sigma regulatory factor (Ser/Thr protein kinase)